MRRRKRFWTGAIRVVALTALVLAAFGAAMPALAQRIVARPALNPRSIDGMSMGAPVNLGSVWLAKQGDNPAWASPGFDDSGWRTVNTSLSLGQQGMKHVDAVWYRTHVRVPAGARNLALLLTYMEGSAEVFVNGARIGQWGSFAPGGSKVSIGWFGDIPDSVLGSGTVTVAIRTRAGLASHNGDLPTAGLTMLSTVLLGPRSEIRNTAALLAFRSYTSNWSNLTLVLLVLLITVALALALRDEPEYRMLAIALAAAAAHQILQFREVADALPRTVPVMALQTAIALVTTIATIEFVRLVLRLRKSRWFTIYYAVLIVVVPTVNLLVGMYWEPRHALNDPLTVAMSLTAQAIMAPAILGLPLLAMWVGWRRRYVDALLLSVPLLINAAVSYYSFVVYLLYAGHLVGIHAVLNANQVPTSVFDVGWNEVFSFAFSISILVFLVIRTIRLARARAQAASEMQAVKTLQTLLMARSQQGTPGYRVETAYRPAAEVGGDFFLVSPDEDGSLVAIVGDVSGKGLLAAMRVSMILGALNRESSREPSEVLERLNRTLLSQGDVGFTTACCVRLEANGEFRFANAGHLNPYVDGQEMEAPGALPLGIRADQNYICVTGRLEPGQRMVLLSDGVPEARAKRELLGFDKLLELTRLEAGEIADAAQRFGQEDDITVLALALALA